MEESRGLASTHLTDADMTVAAVDTKISVPALLTEARGAAATWHHHCQKAEHLLHCDAGPAGHDLTNIDDRNWLEAAKLMERGRVQGLERKDPKAMQPP